jgi:hypothetical protein
MLDPSRPQSAEIVSGGRRFLLHHVAFTELGAGHWQMEFSVGAQESSMTLVGIVRGAGRALMLSINKGPVVGAHARVRPLLQTILSQPLCYDFLWP